MREASLNFLKTLVNTPSPVGHETRGQRVWLDYAKKYADETFSDAYGNCVAVLNKGGGPRIMLAGHADEIAMAVNYIDADGYIYVRRMGGVDAAITKAQRVTIHSQRGPVRGVVGNVAPHLSKQDGEPKLPKIHEIFIDIGVSSRVEAQKLVRVGDPITLVDEFEMLRNGLAISRAFDNRIGTWSVIEALRLLKESGAKLNAEVCAVSNVQEEVGLLGARQIAYSLHPDIALVVDVTHATDYPTVNKAQHGDVKIGSGPAITHGGCNHPEVVKRLEEVAKKKKNPASARSHVQHQRHRYGRDFLDARRHRQRADQPAESLHALARGTRQLEGPRANPATAGRLRVVREEGREVQGEDLRLPQLAPWKSRKTWRCFRKSSGAGVFQLTHNRLSVPFAARKHQPADIGDAHLLQRGSYRPTRSAHRREAEGQAGRITQLHQAQRGGPHGIGGVNVGPGSQQNRDRIGVATQGGEVQGGAAAEGVHQGRGHGRGAGRNIRRNSVCEQQSNDLTCSSGGSVMQRLASRTVHRFRLGALFAATARLHWCDYRLRPHARR
jgi:putative aminopeptidase FrvX